MTDAPESFPYEDLWYIKLINATDKNPLETWGGYSQDYEDADCVYTHAEVLDSPHEHWGVVGIRDEDKRLLIFDLDVHKAPAGFSLDSITIPSETDIVKSQNGGLHVYFVVKSDDAGKERDFTMTYDLGWDIDIRGSFVKHHVVAPNSIPGVGGLYELVNDTGPLTVHDPGDAAERIRYLADEASEKDHGEPLLRYSPGTGFTGSIEIDRDVEPPEEIPPCYHRGLQIRAKNPDDPNINTHQVNTLTALCGLASGYSVDEMVTHFCTDFPPGANADESKTRYHIEHMASKMERGGLAPPSLRTLHAAGILDTDESCNCSIEYHDGSPAPVELDDERREYIQSIEYTTDMQDVFDAIALIDPMDVWLGQADLSGTIGSMDALQVVALEEGFITDSDEYPKGETFRRALDALRGRGEHIPRRVSEEEFEALERNQDDAPSDSELDPDARLSLSGSLALKSTRKNFTTTCPECGGSDSHADDCQLTTVDMTTIDSAYQTVIDQLHNSPKSLSRLRGDVAGWGPLHERIVHRLNDEDLLTPAGQSAGQGVLDVGGEA